MYCTQYSSSVVSTYSVLSATQTTISQNRYLILTTLGIIVDINNYKLTEKKFYIFYYLFEKSKLLKFSGGHLHYLPTPLQASLIFIYLLVDYELIVPNAIQLYLYLYLTFNNIFFIMFIGSQ